VTGPPPAPHTLVGVKALAWWLIPLVATALAVVWVTWVSRPRRRVDTHDSLAEHQRFLSAFDQPVPPAALGQPGDDLATDPIRPARTSPQSATPDWTPGASVRDDES